MKKIGFNNSRKASGGAPFYEPWGFWKYLARVLVFLLILVAILFLLSLVRQCDRQHEKDKVELPDEFHPDPNRDADTRGDFPIDTTGPALPDIHDPNLPEPDDNRLQPVDPDDIITDPDGYRKVVNDRLNVILNSSADNSTFKQWAAEFKTYYPDAEYQIIFYDVLTKLIQIQVPSDQREQVLNDLPHKITDIDFKIFAEEVMDEATSFNDPVFKYKEYNWYFAPIQAYEAWDITQGSSDVVIAVVDSYYDLNHDDINSERIYKPYSVVRRTGNVAPDRGVDAGSFSHGSMVLSIAAGNADNGKGTAGIAPKCRVMPISLGTNLTSMTVMQGILYAIYQGASVVNISLGNIYGEEVHSLPVDEQVRASKTIALGAQDVWDYIYKLADERNVTMVWAAGNEDIYTALDATKRNRTTVRVSAVDEGLRKADFSNYGNIPSLGADESTVSAPGVGILGAQPYNDYNVAQGTSFSAPIVAGAVALIKSLDPTLSNAEIIELLRTTGKPIAGCTTIGPLIQIKDALLKVKNNFGRMDDIMNDKTNLVGLWESVDLLSVTNIEDGVRVLSGDFARVYFDFSSINNGTLIVYEATSTKADFTAPLAVKWDKDKIILTQTRPATNPTVAGSYSKYVYTITADAEGLLYCEAVSETGDTTHFYLKKIKNRTKK